MGLYPGGGLYSGWKICFRFDGLITGGAYNRDFTVCHVMKAWLILVSCKERKT